MCHAPSASTYTHNIINYLWLCACGVLYHKNNNKRLYADPMPRRAPDRADDIGNMNPFPTHS